MSVEIVTVKNGLIFKAVDVTIGDAIARANGLAYAEQFAKKYNGQIVILDENLKIEPIEPKEPC